jgi:hypothetical protein
MASSRIGVMLEAETVLTMISDDNFPMIQPTMLRAFWIASLRSQ